MATEGVTNITDNEPYDNPRKYEVIATEYYGRPKGETLIMDGRHPMIVKGLKDRALRLMNEPASEDDGN